jgi:hypothetical protein
MVPPWAGDSEPDPQDLDPLEERLRQRGSGGDGDLGPGLAVGVEHV